jgi:hypothetical protein
MTRSLAAALACAALLAGCAGNYFRTYQKAHPDWVFAFPDPDANLERTVASLYAPPPIGTQLSIRRLEILRVDVEPWQAIPFEDLRGGRLASSDDAHYAVIANYTCRSRVDLQIYQGEKVGWYLLPKNRLGAFDHFEFIEGCTVNNQFQPAPIERAAVERELRQFIAAAYPASMVHVGELYGKGVMYARADRVDDAKRMLRDGNRAFDVGADDAPTEFETPGVRLEVAREGDVRAARDLLVREIAAAEARLAAK